MPKESKRRVREYIQKCVEKSRIVTFLAACLIGLDRYLSLEDGDPLEPPTPTVYNEAMRVVMGMDVNEESPLSVRLHHVYLFQMSHVLEVAEVDIPHPELSIAINLNSLATQMSANELVAISGNFERVKSFIFSF